MTRNELFLLIKEHRVKVLLLCGLVLYGLYSFFSYYEIVFEIRKRNQEISQVLKQPKRGTVREIETREPIVPKIIPQTTRMEIPRTWAYYIKDPIKNALKTAPFELVITEHEGFSRRDVNEIKQDGKKLFAYVSFGYAETYRNYWKRDWIVKKPNWIGEEHSLWKNNFKVTNLNNDEWKEIVQRTLINVMDKGFDGILIAGIEDQEATEFMMFVRDFTLNRNSRFRILIQDHIEEPIMQYVDGAVKQNLVYSFGGDKNPNFDSDLAKIKAFQNQGKVVFGISYTVGKRWEEARNVLTDNGIIPYNGPIKLDVIRYIQ